MAEITGSKLTEFRIYDYKRVVCVELKFSTEGELVEITGKNEAGKSSLLDGLCRLFGGAKWGELRPVREGAEKAQIEGVLDDGTVISLTLKGPDAKDAILRVKDARGLYYPKGQETLDRLYGKLALDPLEFSNWSETPAGRRQQVEALLAIGGLTGEMKAADDKIAIAAESRKIASAEAQRLTGYLASLPLVPEGTPDAEVTIASLQSNLDKAQEYDRFVARKNEDRVKLEHFLGAKEEEALQISQQIEELSAKLVILTETDIPNTRTSIQELLHEIAGLAPSTTDAAKAAFSEAETTNRFVRQKQTWLKAQADLETAQAKVSGLSASLASARGEKTALLDKTQFPVAGLGFDEDGVTLNGIPFSQAAESQRLVLSVMMAIRMNPKLKLVVIRAGSGLDAAKRALIAKVAVEEGCLVILERVIEDDSEGVVIADGRVLKDNRVRKAPKQAPVEGFDPASDYENQP